MDVVYRLRDEIRQWLLPLKAWQALGLAMFCYGVVKGRHSQLEWIAEELSMFGEVETVRKRLNRWLSNPRIDVNAVCQSWIKWVWSGMPTGQRAILLVDETKISDRLGVMMVSLAYEKRAIPLMWRCYKANSKADYPPEGQVRMIVELVRQVCVCLPPDSQPIVLADRGIGHSSNLIRLLEEHNLHYLLRIKDSARFTIEVEVSFILKEVTREGTAWTMPGQLFTAQRQLATTVHVYWGHTQKEAWCLVTNDPQISSRTYAKRVWQEESFRDLKSGGWQWQTSFIRDPERANRFILILAVAYGWMIALGTQVCATRRQRQRYSVFRRGVQWIKTRLNRLETDLIPIRLDFLPNLS
jgi:hypothetical protein